MDKESLGIVLLTLLAITSLSFVASSFGSNSLDIGDLGSSSSPESPGIERPNSGGVVSGDKPTRSPRGSGIGGIAKNTSQNDLKGGGKLYALLGLILLVVPVGGFLVLYSLTGSNVREVEAETPDWNEGVRNREREYVFGELDLDNDVYISWKKLVEEFDIPEDTAPSEVASALENRPSYATSQRENIELLSHLFCEIRYGDKPVTEDVEEEAKALIEEITELEAQGERKGTESGIQEKRNETELGDQGEKNETGSETQRNRRGTGSGDRDDGTEDEVSKYSYSDDDI